MGKRPASQRYHRRPPTLDRGNVLPEHGGFDPAELRLSAGFENFADRGLFGGFDLAIQVEEAPAQPVRQVPPHSGLARAHEAYKVNAGRAFEFEVHAVWLMAAMRPSTSPGNRRMASTSSQPTPGVTTVRASRSTPRRKAVAHSAAVMVNRRVFRIAAGAWPPRACS